jgi:hypothetical protein
MAGFLACRLHDARHAAWQHDLAHESLLTRWARLLRQNTPDADGGRPSELMEWNDQLAAS